MKIAGFYIRFSTMMFLEWFIMGAWYVTVGNYMASLGMSSSIYLAYTVVTLSAVISPYFMGMVADRFFATERVLAVLHIVGGLAIFFSPWMAESPVNSVPWFIGLLMLHALCFAPTISLTSSLAFHHMTNQEKQFPVIRVFGTIGWIVAGIFVSRVLHADETALPLYTAGIAGIILGLYSFTLPHTPPSKAGEVVTTRKIIDTKAFAELFSRPFVVFLITVFLIWSAMSAYYSYAPVLVNDMEIPDPGFKMSFGQMSEILFMLIIPLLFSRLGVKWMITGSLAAWLLRYALFAGAAAYGSLLMVMTAIILHGISFDFLYVVGAIYVDKKSTAENRGQAQGLFVFITTGVGQMIGTMVTGWLFNYWVDAGGHTPASWQMYWSVLALFSGLVMIAFVLLFHDNTVQAIKKQTVQVSGQN